MKLNDFCNVLQGWKCGDVQTDMCKGHRCDYPGHGLTTSEMVGQVRVLMCLVTLVSMFEILQYIYIYLLSPVKSF